MTTTDQGDRGVAAKIKLRDALASLQEEQSRLDTLTHAREKARETRWELASNLREAQSQLRRAREDEPSRLAYEFASGFINRSPLDDFQTSLDAAQQEDHRVSQIDSALDAEISAIRDRLNLLQTTVHMAMSEVVCASPEYQNLLEQHKAAWKYLRSVKIALRAVASGLHGQLPHQFSAIAERSEPTEATAVGFDFEKEFVNAWATAMAHLGQNADAQLPQV